MARIQFPSQLRGLMSNQTYLEVSASNLKEVFSKIDQLAPMVRSQIFDANGVIRQFVGLFLDERQICEFGDGMQPVHENSQILIVMAIAGG